MQREEPYLVLTCTEPSRDPLATDRRSHRWNPLAYVADDPAMRVDHLQRIAAMLFEDVEGTLPIVTVGFDVDRLIEGAR